MRSRVIAAFFAASCLAPAVIIDRIAVIVGNSIIKDSDIERDIRVTEFLNRERPDLTLATRRKAASRLIDQVFIRKEIGVGDYGFATVQEADQQLDALKKERYKTDDAFRQALAQYGISELDLRTQFRWQLTVLRFVDLRFKPAVLVSDEEAQRYYREHQAKLRSEHPGKASFDDLRPAIDDILTGEKVNLLFFTWLDDQRKEIKLQFREGGLA